jgi:hypothetical protein
MRTAGFATLLILVFASSAFTAITPGPVIANGQSLPVVADLDGNGLDDIILSRSVLLNQGNGQFVSHDLNLAQTEEVIDWLDLNGDGREDLLTKDTAGAGPGQPPGATTYRIYLANGPMTYGPGIVINTGGTAVPYIADVNGDGKDDIILVRALFQGVTEVASEWTVLLSRGDGTFDARPSFQTVPDPQFGRYDHHLLAADLNHDGITDIVFRSVYDLVVLRGTGGGDFVQQKRFLPQAPFGTWSTGLADIDHDGNLDVVMAGTRSVRVLFRDGRGGFTRVATASIAKLRSVTVPDYLAAIVGDQAQAPRNFVFGEFVASGRTEIAAGTAEGDVVILAFVQNKLQEVARTATEFILPDIYAGSFLQAGRKDLYVTWNLGYGDPNSPKPRLFTSQPSVVANAVSQSRGRGHASSPPASPLTLSVTASGTCAPANATALTLTKDGMFGIYQDAAQTLETVTDDLGTMYVRLDAPWLSSPIMSTLSPTDRGYEGTTLASTSCGPQSVSFAER